MNRFLFLFVLIFGAVSSNASPHLGCAAAFSSSAAAEEITESMAALAVVPAAGDVRIRRDREAHDGKPLMREAGVYFSGKASIPLPEGFTDADDAAVDSCELDFTAAYHEERVSDMDSLLRTQGAGNWRRNHLSGSIYVCVYDTRDEAVKIIEGALTARKFADPVDATKFICDFDVTKIDSDPTGDWKYADFVSSNPTADESAAMPAAEKNRYTMICSTDMRPIFDPGATHGDRLAVDTLRANPDLFLRLIRREAHREDLQILGMGTRYYSSYDACKDCFNAIYDVREAVQTNLQTCLTTQGYNIHEDLKVADKFPVYSTFYSTRPYGIRHVAHVPAPEVCRRYTTVYWSDGANSKKHQAFIKYEFLGVPPTPTYWLDLRSIVADATKAPLRAKGSKKITIEADALMDPSKVYFNVRELGKTAATTTIEFKVD